MRLESCRPRPTESKVWFRFVPREGWFPQNTEGLWAVKISDDTARVTSVAFLQNGVAEGDVVRFETDADGLHWAVGRVSASGDCTVRVVPIPSGPLGRSPQACALPGIRPRRMSSARTFRCSLSRCRRTPTSRRSRLESVSDPCVLSLLNKLDPGPVRRVTVVGFDGSDVLVAQPNNGDHEVGRIRRHEASMRHVGHPAEVF